MKTAEEKAKRWLDDNVCGYSDSDIKSLERLLKDQDRITRHACAEAIISIKTIPMTESMIKKTDAHNVCINTRSV